MKRKRTWLSQIEDNGEQKYWAKFEIMEFWRQKWETWVRRLGQESKGTTSRSKRTRRLRKPFRGWVTTQRLRTSLKNLLKNKSVNSHCVVRIPLKVSVYREFRLSLLRKRGQCRKNPCWQALRWEKGGVPGNGGRQNGTTRTGWASRMWCYNEMEEKKRDKCL